MLGIQELQVRTSVRCDLRSELSRDGLGRIAGHFRHFSTLAALPVPVRTLGVTRNFLYCILIYRATRDVPTGMYVHAENTRVRKKEGKKERRLPYKHVHLRFTRCTRVRGVRYGVKSSGSLSSLSRVCDWVRLGAIGA